MVAHTGSMDSDTALSIRLGAIMGRDRYTRDPGPIIEELRTAAGVRVDILNREVGSWVGYYDHPATKPLVVALLAAFPGALPWLRAGQQRRAAGAHGTFERRD